MDGATGQLVWSETYSTMYHERAVAAAVDAEGNLFVVGRGFGTGFYDILVQMYDGETGAENWTRMIGGEVQLNDIGWDIAVDSQGRVVVCGMVGTSPSTAEVWTVVLDPVLGEEIWRQVLPQAVYNIEVMAGWIAVADNDDVILGTRTWEASTGFDLVLRRYAAVDGAEVWARRWNSGGSTADDPRAMTLDACGDVLMAGVSGGDYLVVKFSGLTGEPIWHSTYAGPPNWYDVATSLAVSPNGTVIASGFSDGSGTGWDVATIALAPLDGDRLWVHRFDGHNQSDEARAVAVGPHGGIAVTGYAYSYTTNSDFLVLYLQDESSTAAPADPLLPALAVLTGAWPNPFNPRVELSYALPGDGPIRLTVHDARGRLIATLAEGTYPAGVYAAQWDGRDRFGKQAPSGVYMAVLQTPKHVSSRKLVLGK